jgi:hypothetical protein
VLFDVTRLLPVVAGAIAVAAGYRSWRSAH